MAATSLNGTVVTVSPVVVNIDGATTNCPAEKAPDVTIGAGDRVNLKIRTPVQPLIESLLEVATP